MLCPLPLDVRPREMETGSKHEGAGECVTGGWFCCTNQLKDGITATPDGLMPRRPRQSWRATDLAESIVRAVTRLPSYLKQYIIVSTMLRRW